MNLLINSYNEDDEIEVLGLTPWGIIMLNLIMIHFESGGTVEAFCEESGLEKIQFQVFYTAANQMGYVDTLEAIKERWSNGV